MAKDRTRKKGAPIKKDEEKILPNGLGPEQWAWLQSEAKIRSMSAASLHRIAVDWFITAIDTKRGDVTASQLFDDSYKKEVIEANSNRAR